MIGITKAYPIGFSHFSFNLQIFYNTQIKPNVDAVGTCGFVFKKKTDVVHTVRAV